MIRALRRVSQIEGTEGVAGGLRPGRGAGTHVGHDFSLGHIALDDKYHIFTKI